MSAMPPTFEAETAKTVVVDVVVRGMKKYRPIARRTAAFAPPVMPSSGIVGVCGGCSVAGRFLFWIYECGKNVQI